MSAVSTVYKRPSSVTTAQDDDERAVIYTGGLVTVFMWILVGLASAVNTNLTSNYKGLTVSVTTIDALIMILANIFLIRGIENRNQYFVLPWIGISAWSAYSSHYASIKRMVTIFKSSNYFATLPWVALSLNILALGLRILLILRIMHLALNQWYQKTLERELQME